MQTKKLSLRNLVAIAIYLAGLTLFSGCEKDDPINGNAIKIEINGVGKIDGIIETTETNIATIKATINTLKEGADGKSYFVYNEILSAEFENGGFILNFPTTVPDEYLWSVRELFSIYSFEGITVSDMQTKTGWVSLSAYNNAGEYIGDLSLRGNEWFVDFEYADRSFEEKGFFKSGSEVDCSYNKGLNILYTVYGGNEKTTTLKPVNENFKWYLEMITIGTPDID